MTEQITDTTEWQDVNIGLGEEWDFESQRDGNPLIGNYLGSMQTTVPDRSGVDRETWVHRFAPAEEPDRTVFIWGSYQMDEAFTAELAVIQSGDAVRITYLGKREIKDGAQTMRTYRIQVAKR